MVYTWLDKPQYLKTIARRPLPPRGIVKGPPDPGYSFVCLIINIGIRYINFGYRK